MAKVASLLPRDHGASVPLSVLLGLGPHKRVELHRGCWQVRGSRWGAASAKHTTPSLSNRLMQQATEEPQPPVSKNTQEQQYSSCNPATPPVLPPPTPVCPTCPRQQYSSNAPRSRCQASGIYAGGWGSACDPQGCVRWSWEGAGESGGGRFRGGMENEDYQY